VSGKSVESKNVGGFFVLNQAEVSHIVMTLIWIEIADAIELHWPTKKIFFLVPKMFQLFLPKFGALTSKHKKRRLQKTKQGYSKIRLLPSKRAAAAEHRTFRHFAANSSFHLVSISLYYRKSNMNFVLLASCASASVCSTTSA